MSQKVSGDAQQAGGEMDDMNMIDGDWVPEQLIPEGLSNAGHGLLVGALGGPSSSTSAPLAPLALPSCATPGLCWCVFKGGVCNLSFYEHSYICGALVPLKSVF